MERMKQIWHDLTIAANIDNRHVSPENRPLRGSEHCYTWAVMVKVLPSTSTSEFFPGYFDTKFNALGLIEPILHKFEDLKIANFLNPEEVYFLMTHVNIILLYSAANHHIPSSTSISRVKHSKLAWFLPVKNSLVETVLSWFLPWNYVRSMTGINRALALQKVIELVYFRDAWPFIWKQIIGEILVNKQL